jgi:lipid-binding SYLF domain-containing protein
MAGNVEWNQTNDRWSPKAAKKARLQVITTRGVIIMKKTALLALLSVAMTLPALAQNKIDDRLGNSAEVLKQILAKSDEIPQAYLNKAKCVLVFPAVKKVAVGIGGTYGRGVIVCRTGTNMTGPWSAPAMYKMDVGTLGVQLGSSSTDYVLLVETQTGAQKILSGKMKLGADATAVAGPTGAKAVGANDTNVDVLTYSRAKGGLFAGASLASASLDTDDDANKSVYGKDITATTIVREGGVTTTPAGKPLVAILTKASPKWIN